MTTENDDTRTYPINPNIGVGIVLVRGDKVLLIKRGHAPAFGEWSVPGGLIHVGETVEQAARRELKEECAIEAEFHKVIDIFEYIEHGAEKNIKYHFIVLEILASYIGGVVKASSDALDAKWVGIDDLENLECTDKIKTLVHKAVNMSIEY